MKKYTIFLAFILSGVNINASNYTGSTPANAAVRTFLGLAMNDSIDFIRWTLVLGDNVYVLNCNYGIGKPNTNGFIGNGRKLELRGSYKKEGDHYQFQNGDKILKIFEVNEDILHFMNSDNTLMVGNGGWSYTLNNIMPARISKFKVIADAEPLKDSISFEGRTPCNVPNVVKAGAECYKLKWHITLYADTHSNKPKSYKIFGTAWRKEDGKNGNWQIVKHANGSAIYRLNDHNNKSILYLIKLDENILLFTDEHLKPLVGDEVFSYTLNRKK